MAGSQLVTAIGLLVGLLAVAAVVAIVVRPLRMPYTVGLVAVGLSIGAIASATGLGGELRVTPELVLLVLLPGLVFEAGYRLRVRELRRWAPGLFVLAIPGVLISAGVVAVVLYATAGLPLGLAFVVGAMVSATDPAAVIATFKRVPVSPSLATLVDGESLFNDGTGLVLFAIAVQALHAPVGPGDAIGEFAVAVAVSGAIGLGLGYLTARVVSSIDDHLIQLTLSVVLAYGSYLLADQFHLSGVIATVVAAIVLGNLGPGRTLAPNGSDAIDTVWEFLAYLLTAVVFLLVGLAIPPDRLVGSVVPIAWAIAAVLAGRAIIVYGLLGGLARVMGARGGEGAMPQAWLHVLFWSGLRGAVAVAMALALPEDIPQRALLQDIVFGVVLFTLLVQGTTIGRLVQRTGATGG